MRIEVRGLRKSFGDNEVLRGVDLTLEERGVSIILGGSGAGKSVLLKHIVGLLRPDSGSVLVDGQDIAYLTERQLQPYRARMAYIFQAGGLIHSLSVGENVGLALSERRTMSRKQIARVVAEKLEQVGLEGKEKERPSNLSGGMMKRVAIARALASGPELLLYDEPTAGLDPPTAASIDELIGFVAKDLGVTSAVVTHDMLSVFAIGDRVNFLHKGQVVASDTPEGFRNSDHPKAKAFLERESRGRAALLCAGEQDGEAAPPAEAAPSSDAPRRRWRGGAVADAKPSPRGTLRGQAPAAATKAESSQPEPTHPPPTVDEDDDVDVPAAGSQPPSARRWRGGAMDDTKPTGAPTRSTAPFAAPATSPADGDGGAESPDDGSSSSKPRGWRGTPMEDTKPTPKSDASNAATHPNMPPYQSPAASAPAARPGTSSFDETKPPWERGASGAAPPKPDVDPAHDATKPPWER